MLRASSDAGHGWAGAALLAGLALGAAGCYSAAIAPGEVGVVRPPDAPSRLLAEGTWPIGPYDHVTKYDVRPQEHDERIEAQASDGAPVQLDVTIRFHIRAPEALQLDPELGPRYYAILVLPTVRAQTRRAIGRLTFQQAYSMYRELLESQIRDGSEQLFAGRHVEIEAVRIRNVARIGP